VSLLLLQLELTETTVFGVCGDSDIVAHDGGEFCALNPGKLPASSEGLRVGESVVGAPLTTRDSANEASNTECVIFVIVESVWVLGRANPPIMLPKSSVGTYTVGGGVFRESLGSSSS
tara:strand:- start:74 stop:427 length:354 start_codon:yes stop_codon:yes gene_type:complete